MKTPCGGCCSTRNSGSLTHYTNRYTPARLQATWGEGLDSCIIQRKAQGPSRTCNESKEEEEDEGEGSGLNTKAALGGRHPTRTSRTMKPGVFSSSLLLTSLELSDTKVYEP